MYILSLFRFIYTLLDFASAHEATNFDRMSESAQVNGGRLCAADSTAVNAPYKPSLIDMAYDL